MKCFEFTPEHISISAQKNTEALNDNKHFSCLKTFSEISFFKRIITKAFE